jgi:hypothetical protein
MVSKRCTTCGGQFETKSYVGRDFSYCPKCRSAKRKANWKSNKVHIAKLNRKSFLKTQYGISSDEYEFLLKKQFGECAICRSLSGHRKGSTRLAVDHCHSTGKVRGLLCQPCNTALGIFKDDVRLLKRAIKYLGGI